jgi:hypothetical protein
MLELLFAVLSITNMSEVIVDNQVDRKLEESVDLEEPVNLEEMLDCLEEEIVFDDLEFYLRQGAQIPTDEEITVLKKLQKDEQMQKWKAQDHSQHCMAFHLEGCKRDRTCAFLHTDARGLNTFAENDEVAG